VRFEKSTGTVLCDGYHYTPEELDAMFPGYVLELRGLPWPAAKAGFRATAGAGSEDYAGGDDFDRLLAMYPVAWWLALFGALGLEKADLAPWGLLVGPGDPYLLQLAVALVFVSLAAIPVHRWLFGIADRRVCERIQNEMFRRRALKFAPELVVRRTTRHG
jgi:hypothetical protein